MNAPLIIADLESLAAWAAALDDVAAELAAANEEAVRLETEQSREAHAELFNHLRNWGGDEMTKPDSEFSAAMNVARSCGQAETEAKLGRAFTDAERLIYDSGFYSGITFGMRDARESVERVFAETMR